MVRPIYIPPKGKEIRAVRIFNGVAHNVITVDGNITKDLGPVQKPAYLAAISEEEKNKEKNIQLISQGGIYINQEKIKEEKGEELKIVPVDEIPKEEVPKEEVPKIELPKIEPPVEIPKVEAPIDLKIESPVEIPKVDAPIDLKIETPTPKIETHLQDEKIFIPNYLNSKHQEKPIEVPKVEPLKVIPKVEPLKVIPKEELLKVIPKEELLKVIPKEEVREILKPIQVPKPKEETVDTKVAGPKKTVQPQSQSSTKEREVVDMQRNNKTKEETPKVEFPKIDLSKIVDIKEARFMADENAEKQLEEILKKRAFQKNIEDAAQFAIESKGKIENISKELEDVEGHLGTVSKSVGEICTGVDCIKNDLKKSQESEVNLQKQLDLKFEDLAKRIQKLEVPNFTCDNCGEPAIKPLSSFCPNCGSPIHQWTDENGMQIRGWVPFWKRGGGTRPIEET